MARSEENHFHLTDLPFSRMRIPIRMWRPSAASKALSFSPLVQARGAHTSRVERVPRMLARAKPEVVLARRPPAERAPDARAGRSGALLLIRLAIQDDGGFRVVIRDCAHDQRL